MANPDREKPKGIEEILDKEGIFEVDLDFDDEASALAFAAELGSRVHADSIHLIRLGADGNPSGSIGSYSNLGEGNWAPTSPATPAAVNPQNKLS